MSATKKLTPAAHPPNTSPGVPVPAIEDAARAEQPHVANIVFLVGLHAVAVLGLVAYAMFGALSLLHASLAFGGLVVTTFAISAGYHRLFAHSTYETGPIFRALLLGFGAAAFQNSALDWATKHRRHHLQVDTDRDPYNARRGFWYSHIGWVFKRGAVDVPAADLEADALVRFQHRHYVLVALAFGGLLPVAIGAAFGDPLGGLFFGGVWRLILSYHVTFSINSLAHWAGRQPYSTKGTARDSALVALLTMGEGYHNYHHTFPGDYRNGVRFYDIDPPKWVLRALAAIGVVRNLQRTPGYLIALRRVRVDQERLAQRALAQPEQQQAAKLLDSVRESLKRWSTARHPGPGGDVPLAVVAAYRREFWRTYRLWRQVVGS